MKIRDVLRRGIIMKQAVENAMKTIGTILAVFGLTVVFAAQSNAQELEFVASFGGVIRDAIAYKNTIYVSQRNCIILLDASDRTHLREIGRYTLKRKGFNIENVGRIGIKWPVVFFNSKAFGSYYTHTIGIDVSLSSQIKAIDFDAQSGKAGDPVWGIRGSLLEFKSDYYPSYNIEDPLHPTIVTRTSETFRSERDTSTTVDLSMIPDSAVYNRSINAVKVIGNRLYALCPNGRLDMIDISDPKYPKYLGRNDDAKEIAEELSREPAPSMKDIVLQNIYKLGVEGNGEDGRDFVINDLSLPEKPKRITAFEEGMRYGNGQYDMDAFFVSEQCLFYTIKSHDTGGASASLNVEDLHDPLKPVSLGVYDDLLDDPKGAVISGDLIIVANGDAGITILRSRCLETSNPEPPKR